MLEYAGVNDGTKMGYLGIYIHFDAEWVWNKIAGERKIKWKSDGSSLVLLASNYNELELLKWAREVKQCS